jgi:hypothetical protein
MPLNQPDVGLQLWSEGRLVRPTFVRTSPTTGTITWTLPATIKVYDGVVILLKNAPIENDELPLDGVPYMADQDLSTSTYKIKEAFVVGSFYSDKISTSINVVGLDPDDVYFVSAHAVTNTLNYYSDGIKSYVEFVNTNVYTGRIPQAETTPAMPALGDTVYVTTEGVIKVYDGAVWVNTVKNLPLVVKENPVTSDIGQFIYNVNTKGLYVWIGQWVLANTEWVGTRSQNIIGVGTDGTSDEKKAAIESIKRSLGWPTLCVELDEITFSQCIDKAVREFRRRADNAYTRKFVIVKLQAGQTLYYLNDPALETDKIVDVIRITRTTLNGVATIAENGLYTQDILNSLSTRGFFDLTTIHALAEYNEAYNIMFATEIGFDWNERTRQLQLFKRLYSGEYIVMECSIERTEQDILVDRYAENWIKDWAKAEALQILGFIRSKYSNIPGPGGGVSLNGDTLLAKAEDSFTELKRQINDFEVGNGTVFGNYQFTMG